MNIVDFLKKQIYIIIFLLFSSIYVFKTNQIGQNKKELFLLEEELNQIKNNYNEEKELNLIKYKEAEEQKKRLDEIMNKIDNNLFSDETEFKNVIFLFSQLSELDIKEISENEIVTEVNQYSLNYITFKFDADLIGFGEFLYYVEKSMKYIDTSVTKINFAGETLEISLGYFSKSKKGEGENDI